jgi:hypothetical protein
MGHRVTAAGFFREVILTNDLSLAIPAPHSYNFNTASFTTAATTTNQR